MGDGSTWIAEMQESTREEPGNVIIIEPAYTREGWWQAVQSQYRNVWTELERLRDLMERRPK